QLRFWRHRGPVDFEQTLEAAAPKDWLFLNRLIAHQTVEIIRLAFTDKNASCLQQGAELTVNAYGDAVCQRQRRVGQVQTRPAIIERIIMIAKVRNVPVPLGLGRERGGDREVVRQD